MVVTKFLRFWLLCLSAVLIPVYFSGLKFDFPGVVVRLADILAIIVVFLTFFLRRNVLPLLPAGYLYVLGFMTYGFIWVLLKLESFGVVVEQIQWALLLLALASVYIQSLYTPVLFKKLYIGALLLVCCYVVFFHMLQGEWYRYKALGEAKYVLSFAGVLLLVCFYIDGGSKNFIALCVLYPFIILSMERKGILAFHLVFIFYFFVYRFNLAMIFVGVILIIGMFALPLYMSSSDLSFFSFFEYSNYEMLFLDEEAALWTSNLHRQSLLYNGWDIFTSNLWFGVGPKMLTIEMLNYYYDERLALSTHNFFLDLLVEYGLFGFVLLLIPHYFFLKKILGGDKKRINIVVPIYIYSFTMMFFMSGGATPIILFYFPLFFGFVYRNKLL